MATHSHSLKPAGQFGWGCLGPVAVYVIKASQAVGFQPEYRLPHFGFAFIGTLALMVVVGGYWSRALESHIRWLAMYHGATVPVAFQFFFGSHGTH